MTEMPSLWTYLWASKPRFLDATRRWWQHRKETPEQREARIAATKKRFAEIWIAHKEKMSVYPETRHMQEVREMLDEVILGEDCE